MLRAKIRNRKERRNIKMVILWIILAVVFDSYYDKTEEDIYLTLYRIFKWLAIIDVAFIVLICVTRCAFYMNF